MPDASAKSSQVPPPNPLLFYLDRAPADVEFNFDVSDDQFAIDDGFILQSAESGCKTNHSR